MQLRAADRPGLSDRADGLAGLHHAILLRVDGRQMAIGGHPAAIVTNQDEIAVTCQLIAGIHDLAAIGGADRSSGRRCDIDAVIFLTCRIRAIARYDLPVDRGQEMLPGRSTAGAGLAIDGVMTGAAA